MSENVSVMLFSVFPPFIILVTMHKHVAGNMYHASPTANKRSSSSSSSNFSRGSA